MIYIILMTYTGIAFLLVIKKKIAISKAFLPLILFSIIVNIALSQNYTHSLIPGLYDGISISNFLAAFLISDDQWSQELFRLLFETSILITLGLIVLYFILVLFEKKFDK